MSDADDRSETHRLSAGTFYRRNDQGEWDEVPLAPEQSTALGVFIERPGRLVTWAAIEEELQRQGFAVETRDRHVVEWLADKLGPGCLIPIHDVGWIYSPEGRYIDIEDCTFDVEALELKRRVAIEPGDLPVLRALVLPYVAGDHEFLSKKEILAVAYSGPDQAHKGPNLINVRLRNIRQVFPDCIENQRGKGWRWVSAAERRDRAMRNLTRWQRWRLALLARAKSVWRFWLADRLRRRLLINVVALSLLVLAGYLRFRPVLTLAAPPVIHSYEQRLFGSSRPASSRRWIVVYVSPEDGNRVFFRQPPAEVRTDGEWFLDTRFGNEFGIDMRKAPPLSFTVVAGLMSSAAAVDSLPETWRGAKTTERTEQALADFLRQRGALALSQPARIDRQPEVDCRRRAPRIDWPPLELPEPPVVASPIEMRWVGDRPLFIEVRRDGELVDGFKPAASMPLGSASLDLEPGLYELKASWQQKGLPCPTVRWFQVVGAGPAS